MEKKSEHCKNCTFWDDESDKMYTYDGYRKPGIYGLGRCICPKMRYVASLGWLREETEHPPDTVIVEYDEEWGMLTGPEFGCIHFVARRL